VSASWSVNDRLNEVTVDGQLVVRWEDYGYAVASFEGLKNFTARDMVSMVVAVETARTPGPSNEPYQWPVFISVDYTAPEYFRIVAERQYVRPNRGINLIVTPDSGFFVGATAHRESADLEWPEMEQLLKQWVRQRNCEFDILVPSIDGIPHFWDAHIRYPHLDHSIDAICNFATELITLIQTFQSGTMNRDGILAALRAGQASMLIGLPENQSLEAKRPMKLDVELSKLELSKDVAAMANTTAGGIIVIGAGTRKVDGRDVIQCLYRFPATEAVQKVRGILQKRIYPPIADLQVEAVTADTGELLIIDIPSQPNELKPFMIHGISISGNVREIFFSIPQRQGENTIFLTLPAIHARLLAGQAWLGGRADQMQQHRNSDE
jgi:hypothetical protein